MEVRDAIKLAVDHLACAGAPEEVPRRLIAGGYSAAKAEGLSAACVLACETVRDAAAFDLAQLQETLTAAGTRADLAALIAVEVFSEQGPELRLGEVEGVPVLQLLGDLGRLSPDERLAIREELLEPLFARDCRLVVDLGALSDAPLEVFGVLCADVATMRAAGGDLVLTGLDAETQELAAAYRLAEFAPIASDPKSALERLAKLPATPAAGKRFLVLRGAAEGAGILAIRGALDERSAERAERKVRKVLAKHERLVLDLREVPWISPEGFAFLRAITSELGPRIQVARLLGPAAVAAEAAGLEFTIHADRREALDAFGAAPLADPAADPAEDPASEELASDEVVEAEDPEQEKAETQRALATPAGESPSLAASDATPEPASPEPASSEPASPEPASPDPAAPAATAPEGPAADPPPEPGPTRKRGETRRRAREQRKRDLEAAKLKAAAGAKRAAAAKPAAEEAEASPAEVAPEPPLAGAVESSSAEDVPAEDAPAEEGVAEDASESAAEVTSESPPPSVELA